MPSQCPACKKAVPPDAEGCPFCPMSFKVEEAAPPSPTAPPYAAYAVMAVAALSGGAYFLSSFRASLEPPPPAPAPAARLEQPPELALPASQPGRAAAKVEASNPAPRMEASESSFVGVETSAEALSERDVKVKEWRLRGTIYDLVSLKGVSGCGVVLIDHATNARYETSTDETGRYRTVVPPLDDRGYTVKLSHPRYHMSYLAASGEDPKAMPSVRRRSLAQRMAVVVEAPVELAGGAQPRVSEFFLAPLTLPAR